MMTRSEKIRAHINRADTNLSYAQVETYLASVAIQQRPTRHMTVFILPGGSPVTLTKPHGNRDRLSTMELRAISRALATMKAQETNRP